MACGAIQNPAGLLQREAASDTEAGRELSHQGRADVQRGGGGGLSSDPERGAGVDYHKSSPRALTGHK